MDIFHFSPGAVSWNCLRTHGSKSPSCSHGSCQAWNIYVPESNASASNAIRKRCSNRDVKGINVQNNPQPPPTCQERCSAWVAEGILNIGWLKHHALRGQLRRGKVSQQNLEQNKKAKQGNWKCSMDVRTLIIQSKILTLSRLGVYIWGAWKTPLLTFAYAPRFGRMSSDTMKRTLGFAREDTGSKRSRTRWNILESMLCHWTKKKWEIFFP